MRDVQRKVTLEGYYPIVVLFAQIGQARLTK